MNLEFLFSLMAIGALGFTLGYNNGKEKGRKERFEALEEQIAMLKSFMAR